MGRSQETFGKKEVRKKKEQKRKEKDQKRAIRKSEGKSSFDQMIAYVDEFGVISSTPPDPDKKTIVVADSIDLNMTRNNAENPADFMHKGVVSFFNDSKGYGFIRDLESNKSIFVHANDLEEPVSENNVVIFEIAKGPKGPAAKNVKKFKE
jgi:cold shock CspA family protein